MALEKGGAKTEGTCGARSQFHINNKSLFFYSFSSFTKKLQIHLKFLLIFNCFPNLQKTTNPPQKLFLFLKASKISEKQQIPFQNDFYF